ncbi:MAG: HAMP domain-containing protein [Desulfamplus sp.]|nr:HAMP domain-containing protein [Desulfamplus sp.]
MSKKIGFKVAIIVNIGLFFVMSLGTYLLITKQSNSLEEQLIERGKIESIVGAKMISQILEESIDNGVFQITDVFDQKYVEIPGFDPPKFHTKYDAYLDKAILSLQDEFLNDESVVFAVAVDNKGYLPTHNTRFNQPPTGDKAKDLKLNRTKRIFADETGLKAAQNTKKGFMQKYKRDTGEEFYDFSSPIYVKGKHWGGFRIGFSLDKVNAAKKAQVQSLIILMSILGFISILLIIVMINMSLKPLHDLTIVASNLADGRGLDQPIIPTTKDEIGKLAEVLERLRISLQRAFQKLQNRK